jgi:hypothetical protein
MQFGLRLAANFRAKLGKHEDEETDEEKEAEKILDLLRASYRTLVTGIARNRELPKKEGFVGDPLISEYPELVMVHQFIILEREETIQFRRLGELLEDVPIYMSYLIHQRGIGPAMGGALISTLDPFKARHVSSFWKYAGYDVGLDGKGRSRREEHLVEREYINKKGKKATRMGVTYNPWLKTKLHVLASSFLRMKSPWAKKYYEYKHQIETDPNRKKVTLVEWKKINGAGESVDDLWSPGHIDSHAKRRMIKDFLADFWAHWRALEGLPVTPTYHEARRGYLHGEETPEAAE